MSKRSYNRRPQTRRLNVTGLLLLLIPVLLIAGLIWQFFFRTEKAPEEVVDLSQPVEVLTPETTSLSVPTDLPSKFFYDSGIDIPYPADGVKGIYMSAYGFANATLHEENMNLIQNSNLNAIVLDVKNDWGTITMDFHTDHPLINENTEKVLDATTTLQEFEDRQIYPIARIVTFKDTNFAKNHPEYAFRNPDGSVWTNHSGEAFLNPFMQEVWDYTIDISIEAAKAGFKEIQYDYIRFAENFSAFQPNLTHSMGRYEGSDLPMEELRVKAINDFIEYAQERLRPYQVDIGIDIFGYTATVPEDSDIGQNFQQMAERGDVVSSMIYPSHWGPGYFGLRAPDTAPYEVVQNYIVQEIEILSAVEHPPITRPWLQDFTASYLGSGWYIPYGPAEVKAQVQALKDNGINEFLLWNAGNRYSPVTDY